MAILVLILKFIFYNFADRIVAISKKSKESLKKIVPFNNNVDLILNPYVNKIFKIKKIDKPKNKKFTILSVGRFAYQKNLLSLINAFFNLSKKYDNIELNIIGSGSQKKILTKKIQNIKNIKIIGWKKNVKQYFLKSDLFILNSFYEGLPNVLIDAVNYEVPCISTDVSGARDILHNGKGGYIIPINNQHELEKKMHHIIKNYSEDELKATYAKSKIKKFGNTNLLIFYKTFLKLANSN